MIAMGMMEMPSDQVIGVITVGNCLMAAARTMDMSRLVLAAVVSWSTSVGIAFADRNRVLCHGSVGFLVAQVTVVQVIDVPVVLDLDMPAMGTVLVIVFCLLRHDLSFPILGSSRQPGQFYGRRRLGQCLTDSSE